MKGLIFRIIVAWPQIVRRTLANWQLMSTVVVGVLLASSIMAGTIIYFDALRELALNNSLAQLSVNDTNILIKSDRGPTTYDERDKVVRETEREIQNRVSWMLRDGTTGVKTATFFLTVVGHEASAGTDSPRTFFGNLPRLLDHATIEPGGRAPGDMPVSTAGGIPTIEALVPMENAQELGVQVGDTLSAVPYWEDSAPYIHVVISGSSLQTTRMTNSGISTRGCSRPRPPTRSALCPSTSPRKPTTRLWGVPSGRWTALTAGC